MRMVTDFVYNYREYLVFLLTIILSVFLIFTNKNEQVNTLRSLTLDIMSYFQSPLKWINEIHTLKEENISLKQRNLDLAVRNIKLMEAELENKRLRELLKFEKKGDFNYLPAEIIGKATKPILNSIILNVGEKDGVRKNLPVLMDKGVVGKVIFASKNTSIAQLLTDRNFRLSVKIHRSRANGILEWKYDNIFKLKEVPKSFDIKMGDIILTSGYSDIFPADLMVGTVKEIEDDPVGFFKKVTVRSSVDFSKLEEVFVILNPGLDMPE